MAFLFNNCDTSSSDEFSDVGDPKPGKVFDSTQSSSISEIIPSSSSHEK